MSNEYSNIDLVLLAYLENKYKVEKDSQIFNLSKMLLQRLWQGSICIEAESIPSSEAVGLAEKESKDIPALPLIYDGEYLYIQRYFKYQNRILNKLNELVKNEMLTVITGGPGSGKTTSLAKILADNLKENSEKKILLAAPTGKAAFRMNEALKNSLEIKEDKKHTHWLKTTSSNIIEKLSKLESKTIHRLLGYIHLSVNFRHTKENPLDADIVVIDECSMVDLPLMSKLLDAMPENCRLYLLGDKNQLSSVEAGSVFADICKKYENNGSIIKELKENYRSIESPGIIKLSAEILNKSAENFDNENVHYYKDLHIYDLFNEYKELLNANNPKDALKIQKTWQVLCAVKNGKNGTVNINTQLSEMAFKNKAKYTPIIITENNSQQNLFNGDTGIKDKDTAYFLFGSEIKTFPLLTLPSYDDAFAITIHKSQGSEYGRIAVIYPDFEKDETDHSIFTRELLYTAVTRAKKGCKIYGSYNLLKYSCKREIFRASGIK